MGSEVHVINPVSAVGQPWLIGESISISMSSNNEAAGCQFDGTNLYIGEEAGSPSFGAASCQHANLPGNSVPFTANIGHNIQEGTGELTTDGTFMFAIGKDTDADPNGEILATKFWGYDKNGTGPGRVFDGNIKGFNVNIPSPAFNDDPGDNITFDGTFLQGSVHDGSNTYEHRRVFEGTEVVQESHSGNPIQTQGGTIMNESKGMFWWTLVKLTNTEVEYTSFDGKTLESIPTGIGKELKGLTFDGMHFIAVGETP